VAQPVPGNLDPFLSQAFESVTPPDSGFESVQPEPPRLPFLVRVLDPAWRPTGVAGFTETSRVGAVVAGRGTAQSLVQLLADPLVQAVEGSRAGGPAAAECVASVPAVRGTAVHTGPRAERGGRALVAVIDNGIDVLHKAFRDADGKTRILAVWDQTDPTGPAPAAGYGTLHLKPAIDGYIASGLPAGSGLARFSDPATEDGRHGTHVASIAAGRAAGAFAGGMAPDARIVVVVPNLDVSPGKPESVGYSNSHVDALAFVAEQAAAAKLPVVVNLSQGMNAGAHDGTSVVEAAFEGFTNRGLYPGRVVVKSAGNERGFNGHALLTLASNAVEELVWKSKAVARKQDLIELWFRACDELEFRVQNPAGDWTSPPVTRTAPTLGFTFLSGNRVQLTLQRYCDDNGDSRLAVTVLPHAAAAGIEPGEWRLEVRSRAVKSSGEVHAWVERINSRPTEFRGAFVNNDLTLSIPGTAHSVITVAAVGSVSPVQGAAFSSLGPTRDGREKPTLAAPGVAIQAASKGTGTGVEPMSGTSMAAPHAAGAVALLLSDQARKVAAGAAARQLNANQVAAALAQVTQNFNGRWNPGTGYGVLDAAALLETFD
jgi:endonuclease G